MQKKTKGGVQDIAQKDSIRSRLVILMITLMVLLISLFVWSLANRWYRTRQLEIHRAHITNASHEFRTPLATINTSTYLLGKGPDAERRQYHMAQVEAQVNHITNLVEDLTALSVLDSGKQPLASHGVDLNEIIQAANGTMQADFEESRHKVVLELYQEPVNMRGDSDYLQQALKRLLSNAVQHTPAGGTITIRSDIVRGDAIVDIIDTESGIKEGDLPHIFERFYRADVAGSTRGFGLGLPIVKSIVELHQGRIEVTSDVEKGSVFRIVFPVDNG